MKKKKCKDGGFLDNDLFRSFASITGASYGMPKMDIDNDFLDIMTDIGRTVVPGIQSIALNMVAPGAGTAYSQTNKAIGAGLNNYLEGQAPQKTTKAIDNLDPRYLSKAKGGPIVDNPKTNSGTDTMPVDASGNPSSISGRPTVAMTDSGEVVWNSYVFSDDLGFAGQARKILNKYKMRLGEDFSNSDPISRKQMNSELADLADEQDTYKETHGYDTTESYGFASGGDIKIDPSKRGTFTAAAKRRGMGVQEFADKVLANKDQYSSSMVKKATFASNAAEWSKKQVGGLMPLDPSITDSIDQLGNSFSDVSEWASIVEQMMGSETEDDVFSPSFDSPNNNISGFDSFMNNYSDELSLGINAATLAGRTANIMANKSDYEDFYTGSYVPQTINLEAARDRIDRQRDTMSRMYMNQYPSRAAQIAGITALDESTGSSITDTYMREQGYNADAINRASMVNLEQRNRASELKAREDAARVAAYDSLMQDASGLVQGYRRDKAQGEKMDYMLDFLKNSFNYVSLDDENMMTIND